MARKFQSAADVGLPSLETRLGQQTGSELRELLDLQPASVWIETLLFSGLDGVEKLIPDDELIDQIDDVPLAGFEENVKLGRFLKRIGRGKVAEALSTFLNRLFDN